MSRRLVLAATLGTLLALAIGSSASAHGGTGSDATNFLIVVDDAGSAGLEWNVYGGDALLELVNRTGKVATVLGYQGESYLRFVPGDGVYENIRSPATYLNRNRSGSTQVPADADADAPPDWQQVADGDRYGWHDHRAHWMAPDPPPIVDAAPAREHVIQSWTIPVQLGDGVDVEVVEARGELRWVPGVAGHVPLVVTAIGLLVVTALAVLLTRPRGAHWPGLARAITVLVWIIALANVVRTLDDVIASPAPLGSQIVLIVAAAIPLAVVAALTIVGWRATPAGFLALVAAGLLTMLIFGAGAADQLSASQLVTALPNDVRRYTVAASYLIVIPTLLGAGVGLVRYSRYLNRVGRGVSAVTPRWPTSVPSGDDPACS